MKPYYLANRPEQPHADLAVTDKYTGEVATGVRWAIEDMTELRLLIIRTPPVD